MPTSHITRLVQLIPTNRLNAHKTWWDGRVALGLLPVDNPLLWPELETLAGAAWGRWSNGPYTRAEGLVLAKRICNIANITPPGDVDDYSRDQVRNWINARRDDVFAAVGVWYRFVDNDMNWPRFDDYLEEKGLRRKTVSL